MKRVVVVGSGLAGLSAGYRLRERGWQVTVFEAQGRVGGRVLSESEDGFRVAWTRQNAGRSLKGPPRAPAGGWNVPAATVCASVIVVRESESFTRPSQGVGAVALDASTRNRTKQPAPNFG